MTDYLHNLANISLEAAPWLLLGFVAAGMIKVWVPETLLTRWLGGEGVGAITKAALIGAPLPLCSCGVLPAALGLRRSGASRGATISFLIATPETGVDSIAVSYALLGPIMTVIRPVAAILSAIGSGLLVSLTHGENETTAFTATPGCSSGCGCGSAEPGEKVVEGQGDYASCGSIRLPRNGFVARMADGIYFGIVEMVDDLLVWLSLGLLLAALVVTIFPPMTMASWGSGLPAMLLMLLVGIPMYICATASTPIAASLLFAGISPGTVLIFLLAGPATNIATIGIIRKEMGSRVLMAYLFGICASSLILGMATDWVFESQGFDIQAQIQDGVEWVPHWVALLSGVVLLMAAVMSFTKRAQSALARLRSPATSTD